MKTCTKCHEVKPVTEFSKDASHQDGLRSRCKDCMSIYKENLYAANKDRYAAENAAYYEVNAKKVKARVAKYNAENQEKVKAGNAKWRSKNMDKVRAYGVKWNAANPESRKIRNINRRARESGCKLSNGLSEKLFKLQRGKCACGCKQPLGDDYHLDHIMPLALGGSNTDDNMQLLRKLCNLQKHAKHPVEFMRQRGFLL